MSRPMTADDDAHAALLARPASETSVEQLAELFQKGEKAEADWLIGAEIELIPLRGPDLATVGHELVGRMFESVAAKLGLALEREPSGVIIGASGGGTLLSLEPGGQMEIATRPFHRVSELRDAIFQLTGELARAGAENDVRFAAMGHHPFADRDTVPKMPKARYELMRAYLPTRGTRGLDMMHLTGSVQCAIDFSDEANLVEKMRVAAQASPFLTALVSASPFFRGKPSGFKTMRYEIWRDVDNARSGLWPEMVDDRGMTYARYIERALSTPAMFFRRDGEYRMVEARPFAHYARDGFEGTTVTVADFVDHLTSLFPEIRVKSYIELRGADCVPPAEAVAIAGFWRAILDDADTRRQAAARLAKMNHAGLIALQIDVARRGLEAASAIGPVQEVARDLAQMAVDRFRARSPHCADCVSLLLDRAERKTSPADEMLAIAERSGVAEALEPFFVPVA